MLSPPRSKSSIFNKDSKLRYLMSLHSFLSVYKHKLEASDASILREKTNLKLTNSGISKCKACKKGCWLSF